jgi:hypothetical protein
LKDRTLHVNIRGERQAMGKTANDGSVHRDSTTNKLERSLERSPCDSFCPACRFPLALPPNDFLFLPPSNGWYDT